MIDHLTLPVSDYQKSKDFYRQALAPLGYILVQDIDDETKRLAGFGVENKIGARDFWIREETNEGARGSRYCIAFKAESKEVVDDFYQSAIGAGGRDNGAPGYRPDYHPGYYAAFVYDPDGYNIEAVFDDLK